VRGQTFSCFTNQRHVPSTHSDDHFADHSHQVFRTERASWRAVIQLNVVRSIHLILDAISKGEKTSSGSQEFPTELVAPPELLKIKLRLAPLLQVEETLIRRLTPAGSGETEATLRIGRNMSYSERTKNYMKEVTVNSAVQWKGSFGRRLSQETDKALNWEDPDDPGRILHACSEDMIRLWEDPMTKKFLEAQKLRLQELAGLFAVLSIPDGSFADATIVFWILSNELRLPNTFPLTVRPFHCLFPPSHA
jgi:hypothetical protein